MCEKAEHVVIPCKVCRLAEVFPQEFLPDVIVIFKDAYRDFRPGTRDDAGIGNILHLANCYPDFDPNPLFEFLGFNVGEENYGEIPEITSDDRLERLSTFIALLELRLQETPGAQIPSTEPATSLSDQLKTLLKNLDRDLP